MNLYENITFEEAVRILYYNCGRNTRLFMMLMEDLLISSDEPYKSVTHRAYEAYKTYLADNKTNT